MINVPSPGIALAVTVAILLTSLVLFWPARGWLWNLRSRWRTSERVLIEDALKGIFHKEYARQTTSVQSLAGHLSISANQSAELLTRLEALRLVTREGDSVRLSASGRRRALRVVRVHRLWESFLARETGVHASQWHEDAERREHSLIGDDVDALASRLGNPVFDPHGDPIPTAEGELPPRPGIPLLDLSPHEAAVVVHVEDEPEALYRQLLAADLTPGVQIDGVVVSPTRVSFRADGRQCELTPLCAASVSVQSQTHHCGPVDTPQTLADLKVGELASVVRIGPSCRGLERRRLMDLGIVPETPVCMEMRSAAGDPVAYRIRGSLIALRANLARHVHVLRTVEPPQ
jgi:DtxR family Mn-dependent transcriptional regulator